MSDYERWMDRALALAERGRGLVEPNPLVGALVLDAAGQCVGEGWHERYGAAHAEVNAFVKAGERARGGTLIVTLEPCCHFGKTPPCTNAVLQSGVRRVVVAMVDPFPKVAGGGLAQLRAAGIDVIHGIRASEAETLNAPYLKLLQSGRPWILLKWAMSLDGKIATRSRDSKWITGEQSRAVVHELRGRMDGILVGANTVRHDDPMLTARPKGARIATRIVLTGSGVLPADCQLIRTAHEVPVLVFVHTGHRSKLDRWAAAGAELCEFESLSGMFQELGRRRMTNILVEGGSHLLGALLDAKLADEIHAFIAPAIIGGEGAPSPVGGLGFDPIAAIPRLLLPQIRVLDQDVYIHGRLPGYT